MAVAVACSVVARKGCRGVSRTRKTFRRGMIGRCGFSIVTTLDAGSPQS